MLFKVKNLHGYKLHAKDGFIGHSDEFLFDDTHWTIRYLVADTGSWLLGRQVLLSPYALIKVDEQDRSIVVDLTKKQIEESPSLMTDEPISRKFEEEYYSYFEWPMYWSGPDAWGYNPYIDRNFKETKETQKEEHWDVHLQSTQDVAGHQLHATDGDIGHVSDFIIDDQSWTITNLIVETGHWWHGKKILVNPRNIEKVSWEEGKVFIKLTRAQIKNSAEYKD